MQIDKMNSSQSFGAKLKLYGVNKKHWNLSSEEIKQLALKAEEIGTPQDKVFFKIGKFGTFDNRQEMLADNRNNIEGPLYGSYREIKSTIKIGNKLQEIQLADFVEGNSDKLKRPFKIMKSWLNTLSQYFPNEVRAKHKAQETDKLKKFLDTYDENAQKVSDYLFVDKDTKDITKHKDIKDITKHIDNLKSLKVAARENMIDFIVLDENYSKKSEKILYNGHVLVSAYVKDLISRAHFLSAEKYLQVAKNPTEFAKLRAKEEALLTMFEK